jgi:hypothetical protein
MNCVWCGAPVERVQSIVLNHGDHITCPDCEQSLMHPREDRAMLGEPIDLSDCAAGL